jgi:hypothetical protein
MRAVGFIQRRAGIWHRPAPRRGHVQKTAERPTLPVHPYNNPKGFDVVPFIYLFAFFFIEYPVPYIIRHPRINDGSIFFLG